MSARSRGRCDAGIARRKSGSFLPQSVQVRQPGVETGTRRSGGLVMALSACALCVARILGWSVEPCAYRVPNSSKGRVNLSCRE